MVVPLGWMLDDRREPVPRLFRSPVDPTPRARLRRPRPQRDATGEQLRFDAVTLEQISIDAPEPDQEFVAGIRLPVVIHDDETQPVPERVTDPQVVADAEPAAGRAPLSDDESVAPWQPQFDETDDLKGLLKARGRLLSRAFNGVSADE